MTTNQTIDGVPRELLELALLELEDRWSWAGELRALLDAPAVERKPYAYAHEWAYWISTEGPKDFKAVIEREAPPQWAIESGQARNVIPLYDVPAAKPQGEPVAIVDEGDDGLFIEFIYGENGNPLQRGNKLYAKQPAPVAVVVPEREMYCQYLRGVIPDNRLEVEAHKDGWNAYRDELKRLNPSL